MSELDLRASDADRERTVTLLREHAVAGRLTLDELSERIERTYTTQTIGELQDITGDLPAPVTPSRRRPTRLTVSLIGDTKRTGRWRLAKYSGVISVIGDCVLDLRQAEISDDEVTIEILNLIGDATVIVPKEVEVELTGVAIIGDKREQGADSPPVPGAPLVRLRVLSLIGDVRVRRG